MVHKTSTDPRPMVWTVYFEVFSDYSTGKTILKSMFFRQRNLNIFAEIRKHDFYWMCSNKFRIWGFADKFNEVKRTAIQALASQTKSICVYLF